MRKLSEIFTQLHTNSGEVAKHFEGLYTPKLQDELDSYLYALIENNKVEEALLSETDMPEKASLAAIAEQALTLTMESYIGEILTNPYFYRDLRTHLGIVFAGGDVHGDALKIQMIMFALGTKIGERNLRGPVSQYLGLDPRSVAQPPHQLRGVARQLHQRLKEVLPLYPQARQLSFENFLVLSEDGRDVMAESPHQTEYSRISKEQEADLPAIDQRSLKIAQITPDTIATASIFQVDQQDVVKYYSLNLLNQTEGKMLPLMQFSAHLAQAMLTPISDKLFSS